MPKILNHIEDTILACAREQLLADPAHTPTLRSIAARCHIAVGTIYNYYPSKEDLMAAVLIRDWRKDMSVMDDVISSTSSFLEGIQAICTCIDTFNQSYSPVFQGYSLQYASGEARRRHIEFRKELQDRVNQLLVNFHMEEYMPLSSLYTEALIADVMQDDLTWDNLKTFTIRLFHLKEE